MTWPITSTRWKAAYEAGMASALGAYKNGEPVFFYTWAPNWTIFKFKPGEDVMWINVPKITPRIPERGGGSDDGVRH